MIRLQLDEWATNAGILGFYRILEHVGTDLFNIEDSYLEFHPDILNDFPEMYFNYAFEKFSVAKQKESRLKAYLIKANHDFKRFKDIIFSDIKSTQNKLQERLENESTALKDLHDTKKSVKTIENLEEITKGYISILKQEQVNEVLTLNMIRAYLSELHGQTSFLQKSRSKLNREEHIAFLKKDFIHPILLEQQLLSVLNTATNSDEAIKNLQQFIQQSDDKELIKLIKDVIKALKADELFYCPVIDGQLAFSNYTEAIFVPNAASIANATNYTWNNKAIFPISYVYRLVMFCSIFGLYRERIRDASTDKDKIVYFFIQLDEDLDTLIEVNNTFATSKDGDSPFEKFIYGLLEETQAKAKWITENMMIVEFQNSGKKTSLTQNFLSWSGIQYIQEREKKEFQFISYTPFRNRILRKLLNGESFFKDITSRIRENVQNNYSCYDTYAATLIMFYHNQIKECKGMASTESEVYEAKKKRITVAFKDGQDLRIKLKKRGMENKIPGITYRLLNALTTNNRQQFFETLFRTFLLVEKRTGMYMRATREHSDEFEGIASAFLSGLNDEVYRSEAEETK